MILWFLFDFSLIILSFPSSFLPSSSLGGGATRCRQVGRRVPSRRVVVESSSRRVVVESLFPAQPDERTTGRTDERRTDARRATHARARTPPHVVGAAARRPTDRRRPSRYPVAVRERPTHPDGRKESRPTPPTADKEEGSLI